VKNRLPHLLLLTCAFLVTPVAAQNPLPPPNGDYNYHLPGLDNADWANSRSNITRPAAEARVLTKGVLAPAEADRLKYASFLSQSNTGLLRLLPRQFNNSKFFKPNVPKIHGGGAYYSFAHLSHEYGFGSDLELATVSKFYGSNEQPPDHHFQVGFAGADFGLLTNIGDVPIESVSRNDANLAFMFNYKPPRAEQRARCEYRMLGVGIEYSGQKYASRAAIETNSTYLLRSINYDTSDVLVAFRVVRQDQDDGVTIAWKLLKNFSVPTLDRHKVDPNFKCPIR
jgi:hypothetical protein